METGELHRMDYGELKDLAKSLNIRVIEAVGLDLRRGIRFVHDGADWVAVDSSLSAEEKVRTLGFLLKNEWADIEARAARLNAGGESSESGAMSPVLTLCC